MPLNVNETQTNVSPGTREAVTAELLREMTSWSPRERMGMFRKWLRGSLSLVHLHVLTVLETGGPLPMGRLAEALDVSVASATGIVDRMEQRGLVARRDDDTDRRVVLVETTESGLVIFQELDQHRHEMFSRLLERLTDEEQAALLVGLRGIRRVREEFTAEEEATAPAAAASADTGSGTEGASGQ